MSKHDKYTGCEAIELSRSIRISMQKQDLEFDLKNNSDFQLLDAAKKLLFKDSEYLPFSESPEGWSDDYFQELNDKPYLDRLILAGAFIAAEIDRVKELNKNQKS